MPDRTPTPAVVKYHKNLIRERASHDVASMIPHIASYHLGLSADTVKPTIAAGDMDFIVAAVPGGDGITRTSVHRPADPLPADAEVRPLMDVLNEAVMQRDLMRASRIRAAEAQSPMDAFSGTDIDGRTASERHERRLLEAVLADLKELRGLRPGIPELRPPSPSASGKLSIAHQQRYLDELSAREDICRLELARLRELNQQLDERVDAELTDFAIEKLASTLGSLSAEHRAQVERAIRGSEDDQTGTFLISRPIVGRDGVETLGFSIRTFDSDRGGRPTRESLAREFGLANEAGIRISSVAELLNDARSRLTEEIRYGPQNLKGFPQHNRDLFSQVVDDE
jgi:hypothetical protein